MEGITPDYNPQYDGVSLDPPPSMRQGFGAAHLGRSLPIASNPSGWSMQVTHIQVPPQCVSRARNSSASQKQFTKNT